MFPSLKSSLDSSFSPVPIMPSVIYRFPFGMLDIGEMMDMYGATS